MTIYTSDEKRVIDQNIEKVYSAYALLELANRNDDADQWVKIGDQAVSFRDYVSYLIQAPADSPISATVAVDGRVYNLNIKYTVNAISSYHNNIIEIKPNIKYSDYNIIIYYNDNYTSELPIIENIDGLFTIDNK